MAKFVFVSLLALGAFAQARPTSFHMTCDQARSLVRQNGAVVMNYRYSNAAGWLYERFVAHAGYCSSGEVTRAAWVPTTDKDSCFVGYTCHHRDNH